MQESFVTDARATGEAFRLPNPAVAETPYVFTSLTAPQVRQEVDKIIGGIIAGLTQSLPEPKGGVIQRLTTRGPKEDVLEFSGRDYPECYE